MIQTAVTVSLVEQARGGPFVLWGGIEKCCRTAASLGFDAIELFASAPNEVPVKTLKTLLDAHDLKLAAVGTGAGMLVHQLSLCDPDLEKRKLAKDFIRDMIRYGAQFGAPAIIGSMQGRWGGGVSRKQTLHWLRNALNKLGDLAGSEGLPLLYEPLNRYETDLCNTVEQGIALCQSLTTQHVRLLADIFHMSVEEENPVDAIAAGKDWIAHVHFVDSNRRAPGMGHLDLGAIAKALTDSGYDRFVSAECFPLPDSETAAKSAITAYRQLLPQSKNQ